MDKIIDKIDQLVDVMEPISLKEMDSIKLMNRIDKKYMINISRLPLLLQMAANDYYVQFTDGQRRFVYRSCYYDTPDADFYRIHQSGRLRRQKIRVREYVSSHLTFLEIKNKSNKGRTSKKRIEVPNTEVLDQETARAYIDANAEFGSSQIAKRLQNSFYRITLVNKKKTERLTIDIKINFENYVTGISNCNPDLCIIELKRDGNAPSPFLSYFAQLHIKGKGISKYCYGMMLTDPSLKRNRFKEKMRYIHKITMLNTDY
jgi:hypothetical protein